MSHADWRQMLDDIENGRDEMGEERRRRQRKIRGTIFGFGLCLVWIVFVFMMNVKGS